MGTQPFPESPWHCPVAGITLLPFQGCQLRLHPVHSVGVLRLGGKVGR